MRAFGIFLAASGFSWWIWWIATGRAAHDTKQFRMPEEWVTREQERRARRG